MSNQQVTPFEAARQPETLQSLLRQESYQKRFQQVLGERAGQFIGSIMSIGATMPDVEPRSILASAAIAAALDLPIDKNLGFAWIIPYRKGDRKMAQFQIGYKGYIQLALRTSQYSRMNAQLINAEALGGFDSVGEPIIDWAKLDDSKPAIGYAFAFRLVNGFVKTEYWSKEKVEAHAKRYSQSFRGPYDSPWKSNFDAMGLKTVIANTLRHWGILSVEMQSAMKEDQGVRIDVDTDVMYPDNTDVISGPKFDADEKQLADAGLAPADPPAEQPKRTRQRRESPTPAPTEPPAQTSAPAAPQTSEAPVPTTQPANPLESEAYKQLRQCMTQSGITDAELINLCRTRGMMVGMEELAQLNDAVLLDLVDKWTMVAGQVRLERRKGQGK